jgi:hypothetical protein
LVGGGGWVFVGGVGRKEGSRRRGRDRKDRSKERKERDKLSVKKRNVQLWKREEKGQEEEDGRAGGVRPW